MVFYRFPTHWCPPVVYVCWFIDPIEKSYNHHIPVVQGGAPKIASLIYNSNNWDLRSIYHDISIVHGGFFYQLITGGQPIPSQDVVNPQPTGWLVETWCFSLFVYGKLTKTPAKGDIFCELSKSDHVIWSKPLIHGLYLDLRKDTNNCPFARFLPWGRISCEGAGNCHFLTTVVNFGFRTFWADFALLCVEMCRFFWVEIPGKGRKYAGKRRKYPGRLNMTLKWKHEVAFFYWNGNC